jgi:hypothetical protein
LSSMAVSIIVALRVYALLLSFVLALLMLAWRNTSPLRTIDVDVSMTPYEHGFLYAHCIPKVVGFPLHPLSFTHAGIKIYMVGHLFDYRYATLWMMSREMEVIDGISVAKATNGSL